MSKTCRSNVLSVTEQTDYSGQSNLHQWLASMKIWREISQGHHGTDRLEERVVEPGRDQRSTLKGRNRAVVNQREIYIIYII